MIEKLAFVALVIVTLLLAKDALDRHRKMRERADQDAARNMEIEDRMARIRARIHEDVAAGKNVIDLGKILEEIR